MKIQKWIRITNCENIPLREGRAVKIGGHDIAVFNLGDRFLAVDNRCPHNGGPLADGIVSGDDVVCPLHAWKFGLETGKGTNSASASSCVGTFRTRVEHGVVLLELPVESAMNEDLPTVCFEPSGTTNWNQSSATTGD